MHQLENLYNTKKYSCQRLKSNKINICILIRLYRIEILTYYHFTLRLSFNFHKILIENLTERGEKESKKISLIQIVIHIV